MSLHHLANHLKTAGRGDDSMLVHMTPGEVHGLQTLAMSHGGSLTINPETGLPEAGFLSSILPMVAGMALAPLTAGTSLAFLGATPLASALTIGGISALATGSLQKGLMAGLGAYGGAGLGESLAANAPGLATTQVPAVADQTIAAAEKSAAEKAVEASTGLTSEGGYAGIKGLVPNQVYTDTPWGEVPTAYNPAASAVAPTQAASAANPYAADFLPGGGFNPATNGGVAGGTSWVNPYASKSAQLAAGTQAAIANPLPFLGANVGQIGMAAAPLIGEIATQPQPTVNAGPQGSGNIYEYKDASMNPTGAAAQNNQTVYNSETGLPSSAEKTYFNWTPGDPTVTPADRYNAGLSGLGSSLTGGQNPYFWGNQGVNPYDPYNSQAAQKPLSGFGRMLFQNARGYADGGLLAEKTGAVESMSDANAIGANNSYPMSNQPQPAYLLNTARPAAGNVINPSSGMAVDPFSGEQQFAAGGIASLGGYSDGGRLLKGPGDGLSDGIPARIGNKQPARLANNEFVIPADVVSALGGGSTDAGAKKFYAMMDRIRQQAHGTKKQIRKVSEKVLPA